MNKTRVYMKLYQLSLHVVETLCSYFNVSDGFGKMLFCCQCQFTFTLHSCLAGCS